MRLLWKSYSHSFSTNMWKELIGMEISILESDGRFEEFFELALHGKESSRSLPDFVIKVKEKIYSRSLHIRHTPFPIFPQ